MFQTLKEQLNILEVIEEVLGYPMKEMGENTWSTDDDICPSCGHSGCFRVKHEGLNEESIARCFSEDLTWDVTSLVAQIQNVTNLEAAKFLANKYEIALPNTRMVISPIQETFDQAAKYYHQTLLDTGPCVELNGLTPLDYQIKVRGHAKETLEDMSIGWSDGGCATALESVGIHKEILDSSGLINDKGNDYLPRKCFIYPHKVDGKVSHFTFKDPLKRIEYQLPKKYKLNSHSFYNSDSLKRKGPVIIVEGENDLLSIIESGWSGGVIASIGTISTSQVAWLTNSLQGREVITIFDTDIAGDRYREKVQKNSSKFGSLLQIKISSGVKDIDEYLKFGGDLQALLINSSKEKEVVDITVEELEEQESNLPRNIIVKKGAYYKIKKIEGEEQHIKLSNFTISLMNIYVHNKEREREVLVVREDGKRSETINIPSEAKVSLKPFKTLIANAVDASFYGREEDMTAMWEYIYATGKEKLVHLPNMVGRDESFLGWLFGDCFIADTGSKYLPDPEGVTWITNGSVGVKPLAIIGGSKTRSNDSSLVSGIPRINTDMTNEEVEELIGGFIVKLGNNLGNLGDALTIMAWFWATAHSNEIFNIIKFFPFLYFWGSTNQGKSTIIKWLLSFYGMEEIGYTTMDMLNSGVSFSRKLSYYASLPMCIDELRTDANMVSWQGTFRSWYMRGSRDIARGESEISSSPTRSTIIFGGEDRFQDPGARNRCITIRISKIGRELKDSYSWITEHVNELPSIGHYWIKNRHLIDMKEFAREYKEADILLAKSGAPRTSKVWSLVTVFGMKLAAKYTPEYDYLKYALAAAQEDYLSQMEESTLISFWSSVEGLQSMDNPPIHGEHLRRDGDILHVWFAEVFRIVDRYLPLTAMERFSSKAVSEGIKEETYYVSSNRVNMGMGEIQRRVISLDLTKAPVPLQNIANYLDK